MNQIRRFRSLYMWCKLLIVGGIIFSCMSTPAFADTPLITGNVTAGTLTETASAGYNFTGTIGSTATFTMPFTVSDLTGTTGAGSGWHVTLNTSTFVFATHASFLTTAVSMTAITAVCTTAGTCSGSPITNGASSAQSFTSGTGATIFSAPITVSSGVYTVTPSFSVTIPGDATITTGGANVYTSTFTLAVVSGP